ncbi:methyl-accepting chemotaxis protein [Trinickia mobilis]|uniref:methyl-accepting chemotaxis protein n=1 Tax=Trinickia mobilis TaxID=2816356 RepID=UPI001A906488|nr:methyl-accepting chemotaxis protein [Trinickia mobilis]
MFFLSNLSLRRQLWILLGLLAAATLVIAFCQWQLNAANASVADAFQSRYTSSLLAGELRRSSDDLTRLARTYVATGDSKWERQYDEVLAIRSGKQARPLNYDRIYWDFRAADEPVTTGTGETVSLIDLMKRAGFTDAEFAKLHEAEQNSNDLARTETVAMNLVKGLYPDDSGNFTKQGAPDMDKARMMMNDAEYHRNKAKIMHPIDELLGMLDARTESVIAAARATVQFWKIASVTVAIVMLVVFATAMTLVFKRVISGLDAAMSTADRVASGDLTSDFSASKLMASGKDEIARVLAAVKSMNDGLARIVTQLRSGADAIATGSAQISAGNTDLSQRTEEQAASLGETASSMEELTSTVRQNADNAKKATALAHTASEIAERGGKVVGRVVDTMHDISKSSAKVAEIISVIEGIAFQTNILALNAAVEAARAGEQGRGFAVVAGEVRTLAQRSATAAKEIKELIGESVARVDSGSTLVEEAGHTIGEVVQSVKRVTDIMSEITAASEAQSAGIEQVNTAVTQMDEVTQQNAALVEEASAAAQSLDRQAQALREAVAVFKVGDTGSAGASSIVTAGGAPALAAAAKLAKPLSARRAPRPLKEPAAAGSSGVATESDWQTF